jgi:cytochrome P450
VLLALASGNRDERQAPDADVFRIDRKGFRHLSFGLGGHACLGMALVLLQFETVLEVILGKDIRLSLEPEPIHWQSRAGHRWPETLAVKIE